MSHNAENLSLDLWRTRSSDKYKLPDFFYINSSVKILNIELGYFNTIVPEFSVSWTSLQKLSLCGCDLFDESMAKILSGCPLLESLTLYLCQELKVLDLGKSLRLRTLVIDSVNWVPTHIVAPHIHSLILTTSQLSCSLVDVASLNEAKIDIGYLSIGDLKPDFLQVMVLKMLEKLRNVEKLTFAGNFIQILSLAEIRGVPFPMLRVKTLTLETEILRYIIPGMERLLQNSPDLEMLTLRGSRYDTLPGKYVNQYLTSQGLNPDQCWRPKHGVWWNSSGWRLTPEHVASLVEIVLKNTNKIEKMVLVLYERCLTFNIKEVIPTLSLNTNVTIVLSSTDEPIQSDDWYDWCES